MKFVQHIKKVGQYKWLSLLSGAKTFWKMYSLTEFSRKSYLCCGRYWVKIDLLVCNMQNHTHTHWHTKIFCVSTASRSTNNNQWYFVYVRVVTFLWKNVAAMVLATFEKDQSQIPSPPLPSWYMSLLIVAILVYLRHVQVYSLIQ